MSRLTVVSISHSKPREHDAVHGPATLAMLPDGPLGARLQAWHVGSIRSRRLVRTDRAVHRARLVSRDGL